MGSKKLSFRLYLEKDLINKLREEADKKGICVSVLVKERLGYDT